MKRIIKKILKIILALVALLLVIFAILYITYNQPLPEGKSGLEADAIAQKMLNAINYETYKQTRFLEWSFDGDTHHYIWDKFNGKVQVKWDDYLVNVDLIAPDSSIAYKNDERLNANDSESSIEKAISYFNNDSFWLVAPFKVFDKGTARSIVELEDGTEGLLISYSSGGTTPGDTYLWKLQPNGFPISYQMWVKIIPIGGLEASWDDWKVMENGLFLPASHKLGPIILSMGEVRGYTNTTFEPMGL